MAACSASVGSFPPVSPNSVHDPRKFTIRSYQHSSDFERVDQLEKLCDAGPSAGSSSLFTDLLGDPLCRIRNFPAFSMLVAEVHTAFGGPEIVGLIRAGFKEVACGGSADSAASYAPTAYILGLRVAPQYRRLGIAAELVKRMESWCKEQGAQYAYIATEKDNEASVGLFTRKLGYAKFRTPAILVQPVYTRPKKLSPCVKITQLGKQEAIAMYSKLFQMVEFYPKDMDAVMGCRLHKGTWMAVSHDDDDRESYAVLSLWKCNEIFKLELKGASWRAKGLVKAARFVGKLVGKVSGAAIPTPPNVFRPFGLQLAYGLHAQGEKGPALLRQLCWFAHNVARRDGCAVLAAEVGSNDPLRAHIPHWPSLSCDEDLWCMKRLASSDSSTSDSESSYACTSPLSATSDCAAGCTCPASDWSRRPPPLSIFVDPRDF